MPEIRFRISAKVTEHSHSADIEGSGSFTGSDSHDMGTYASALPYESEKLSYVAAAKRHEHEERERGD
jgi:hypothetical protein